MNLRQFFVFFVVVTFVKWLAEKLEKQKLESIITKKGFRSDGFEIFIIRCLKTLRFCLRYGNTARRICLICSYTKKNHEFSPGQGAVYPGTGFCNLPETLYVSRYFLILDVKNEKQ